MKDLAESEKTQNNSNINLKIENQPETSLKRSTRGINPKYDEPNF